MLGGKLGSAIGVNGLGLEILGQDAVGGLTGLRPDRGQKHEALDASPLCRPRKPDRGLGVEQPVVVFRHARHGLRNTRGMDHRIDVREALCHVVRLREIADQGARAFHWHGRRPAQQHTQAITALAQPGQQMLPDETRGTGQRDKGLMGRSRGRCRRSSIPAP